MGRVTKQLTEPLLAIAFFFLTWFTTSGAWGGNDCLRAGFTHPSFDTPIAIPDGSPPGITIGPIHTADDASIIGNLVLAINITHRYTGDLEISLAYDENNDGVPELTVPVELYRARSDGCAAREPFAYTETLNGIYFFRDEASSARPDPIADEGTPSFSGFAHLRTGGSFQLRVVDSVCEETGTVRGWSVHYDRNMLSVDN